MKTNGYSFDIFTNTLTITDSFAKKASQYSSPEYKILMKLRADNSGLQIVKAEKRTGHKTISFKEMEGFISKCADSEKRLKEFKRTFRHLPRFSLAPITQSRSGFLRIMPTMLNSPSLMRMAL